MAAAKESTEQTKDEAQKEAPSITFMEVERKVEQLNPTRMKEGQYERTVWVITAHENTEPEDLVDPAYWSHVASKLRPWDRIEARANDGTWYAEFLILEAGRNWARAVMLTVHKLTNSDVALSQATAQSPYEVSYRGPHDKWSVIRKGDREVMHAGEQTQGGAVNWMVERLKAGG